LLLAPVVGRTALLGLLRDTPYVRKGGLGAALAEHLPREPALWIVLGCTALAVVMGGWTAVWVLLLALGAYRLLRRAMCRRLGGTTGDTAGALLELLELVVLLSLALLI
ncbi:adenosylcobinamide-GDP ribazoletransferase, partial [Pseudomonas sp.]|uniref:adenosylcobinamide-GDP ribazoletransferase n=1 Tax=Pseudomonas sp. TaxID=306 RepID=UPI0028AA15F6